MTELEKHILENKEHLNPDSVDKKIWLGIENDLLKKKNDRSHILIKFLLAGLITMVIGGFLLTANSPSNIIDEERILAEYNLTDHNFMHLVNTKKNQLVNVTIPENKIEDVQILLQQLEFMDGQFQDYRNYIEENGYQEFIGDQILNFYKSKIELLDKIQKEIEKINYYEKLQPSTDKYIDIEI